MEQIILSKNEEVRKWQEKVIFLQGQLRQDNPYLRFYSLGAGMLLVSITSLMMWWITGIGIPFHPVFAVGTIPFSVVVIVIAFMIRPKE